PAPPTRNLVSRLKAEPLFFQAVDDIEGSDFFARNGLLFRSTDDVANMAKGLAQEAPLIGAVAGGPRLRGSTRSGSPSLRGSLRALSLGLIGVQNKMVTVDALARPRSMVSGTVEAVLATR